VSYKSVVENATNARNNFLKIIDGIHVFDFAGFSSESKSRKKNYMPMESWGRQRQCLKKYIQRTITKR